MLRGRRGNPAPSYLFWFAVVVALCGLGCKSSDEQPLGKSRQMLRPTAELSIELPPELELYRLAGIGVQRVNVGAGVEIVPVGGSTTGGALLAGGAGLTAEPDAELQDVWSPGLINLRDRVSVHGNVSGPSYVPGNNVALTGEYRPDVLFGPSKILTFAWELPTTPTGSVLLEPDQVQTIAPAAYDIIRVKSRSKLKLSSGVYRSSSFEVEPQAVIEVDQSGGPVWVIVDQAVHWRGRIVDAHGGDAFLGLFTLASQPSYLEAHFDGVFLSPSGQLTLRATSEPHRGFFYADTLTFDSWADVVAVPPDPILVQTDWFSPADCVRHLGTPDGSPGDLEYQMKINRFCAMPGEDECLSKLVAKVNVDATSTAWQLIGEVFSPARYLAVIRDRMLKKRAALADPAKAAAFCEGTDSDGDMVPDSEDACPGTPFLVATSDDGCEITELPPAPAAEDVKPLLDKGAVMLDPRCGPAQPLPRGVFGSFYQPADRSLGTFLVLGRVFDQPTACPIWYVVEVEELEPGATETVNFIAAFGEHEASTALAGLPMPVPPQYIQFNPLPGDSGTRGLLGDIGGRSHHRFRVKVVNGAGASGGWSDWVRPTREHCTALGFECQ